MAITGNASTAESKRQIPRPHVPLSEPATVSSVEPAIRQATAGRPIARASTPCGRVGLIPLALSSAARKRPATDNRKSTASAGKTMTPPGQRALTILSHSVTTLRAAPSRLATTATTRQTSVSCPAAG